MKKKEITPIIKRTTRPSMSRMEAFKAFCKAEPLISLDWQSFKRVWPTVHPKTSHTLLLRCGKCSGTGELPHFKHIKGGLCFDCNGRGKNQVTKKEWEAFKNSDDPRVQEMATVQ